MVSAAAVRKLEDWVSNSIYRSRIKSKNRMPASWAARAAGAAAAARSAGVAQGGGGCAPKSGADAARQAAEAKQVRDPTTIARVRCVAAPRPWARGYVVAGAHGGAHAGPSSAGARNEGVNRFTA